MSDKMSIDKNDPTRAESEESMDSSPEGEIPPVTQQQQQSQAEQPKRKGGRKPIYATSEERKQRNRQAQAAFRERRTEYIKQLEEAIRTHEQNLANLQAAHRQAADECLMLRYKNSLLERILLEKGIDVQAELRAKTGSPSLGPTHMPQNFVHPPPIQRAMLNRHHARRSNSSIAPKLEPGISISPLPAPTHSQVSALSPKSRHTPSSHSASPTATTSFGSQHGASPASSDHLSASIRPSMPPGTMKPPPPHLTQQVHALPGPRQMQIPGIQQPTNHARTSSVNGSIAAFYPTPGFQNHIEQLEQEYDAAAEMLDDPDNAPDTPSGPGPYPGATYPGEQQMTLSSPVTTGPGAQQIAGQSPIDTGAHTQHPAYPSMTQLLDPSYDFDPFGLSASMAFPTQFSFDTSNMR